MKFKYKDKVKIIDQYFYRDAVFTVIDFNKYISYGAWRISYELDLEGNKRFLSVDEESLELIPLT